MKNGTRKHLDTDMILPTNRQEYIKWRLNNNFKDYFDLVYSDNNDLLFGDVDEWFVDNWVWLRGCGYNAIMHNINHKIKIARAGVYVYGYNRSDDKWYDFVHVAGLLTSNNIWVKNIDR